MFCCSASLPRQNPATTSLHGPPYTFGDPESRTALPPGFEPMTTPKKFFFFFSFSFPEGFFPSAALLLPPHLPSSSASGVRLLSKTGLPCLSTSSFGGQSLCGVAGIRQAHAQDSSPVLPARLPAIHGPAWIKRWPALPESLGTQRKPTTNHLYGLPVHLHLPQQPSNGYRRQAERAQEAGRLWAIPQGLHQKLLSPSFEFVSVATSITAR
jgi:hypothetical protein